jgi:DNA-binding Lrp family transcriptional regulator
MLTCVAPDLSQFHAFIIDQLTAAPNVAHVKSMLVIRAVKSEPIAPL